jgi:hypothetical protein
MDFFTREMKHLQGKWMKGARKGNEIFFQLKHERETQTHKAVQILQAIKKNASH